MASNMQGNAGLVAFSPGDTAANEAQDEVPTGHSPMGGADSIAGAVGEHMRYHHGDHAEGAKEAHHPAHDAHRAGTAFVHHDRIAAHSAHGGGPKNR